MSRVKWTDTGIAPGYIKAALPHHRTGYVWMQNAGGGLTRRIKFNWQLNTHVPDVEYRARLVDPSEGEIDLGTYPTEASAKQAVEEKAHNFR